MTHVSGPDFLSIQVRDLQRSAGFYERELGLQPMAASPPGVVAFQTSPSARLGLACCYRCAPMTPKRCMTSSRPMACRS